MKKLLLLLLFVPLIFSCGDKDQTKKLEDRIAELEKKIENNLSLAIGDAYQGGIVFYLDENGGGLIAAPSDQSNYFFIENGSYDKLILSAEWGCKGISIAGADGTAIGTGNQNTIDIEEGCTTSGTAADICANLTLGGYSDWFLPSKDELNEMYINLYLQGFGGFSNYGYWSSTESHKNNAWWQFFSNGSQNRDSKEVENGIYVRAVRAF
jgi:hypothetical protein